jgi:hypothetical protein
MIRWYSFFRILGTEYLWDYISTTYDLTQTDKDIIESMITNDHSFYDHPAFIPELRLPKPSLLPSNHLHHFLCSPLLPALLEYAKPNHTNLATYINYKLSYNLRLTNPQYVPPEFETFINTLYEHSQIL